MKNFLGKLKDRAAALFRKHDAAGYAQKSAKAVLAKAAEHAPATVPAPKRVRRPQPKPLFVSVLWLPFIDPTTKTVRYKREAHTFNAGRNAERRDPTRRSAMLVARRARQLAGAL